MTAQNITADLTRHAQSAPDRVALMQQDLSLSYAALNAMVDACAWQLRSAGVRAEQVVMLCCADQERLAVAMLGLMRLGATPLPLALSSAPAQRDEMLQASGAAFLASDVPQRLQVAVPLIALGDEPRFKAALSQDLMCEAPQAPCLLVAGSGSTGKPKLIPITHQVMRARTEMLGGALYALRASDRLMVASRLDFATPIYRLLSAWSVGCTFAYWEQQGALLAAVQHARPDVLHLSVLHAERLLEEAKQVGGADLSGVRVVSIGASTVSESLRQRLREQLRLNLHINYGTNESLTLCFAPPHELDGPAGVVGRPPPGVEVEVVDASDRPVAVNQPGELRTRSAAMIAGYRGEEDSSRFRGGWFYPGDLGKFLPDGRLVHLGRSDQAMIMNGINIYPAEIEQVLGQHDAVCDAVAFPLAHPVHQDIPVCAVALHPGRRASAAELRDFARHRLAGRAPREVFVLEAIPRNAQGKLDRAELRRQVSAQMTPQSGTRQVAAQALPAAAPAVLEGAAQGPAGPRQLRRHVSLQLSGLTQADRSYWASWCALVQTDPPDIERSAASRGEPRDVTRDLRVLLRLAARLLQDAGVPAFDALALLSCRPLAQGADAWELVVACPRLDSLPPAALRATLQNLWRIVASLCVHPPTPASKLVFFARLQSEVLQPLRRIAPPGKSTIHVLRAAHAAGIPFVHLGLGVFQLGWGARARKIDRSTNLQDSAMGSKLAQSKVASAQLLRAAGLPAPVHVLVASLETARQAGQRLGWPVVVKPADRDRGEGVSVDVLEDSLEAAFQYAQSSTASRQVIVERQVPGVCHRLFLSGQKLLYAVKRLPMGVYGDGVRTVDELVTAALAEQEMRPDWQRSELRPIDPRARDAMQMAGCSELSVPAAGQFVPLRRIESTADGGVDEEVTDSVHPENLRAAVHAARLFGLDVAGVDIISPDIREPWYRNGAILNEVNYAPLLGGGAISRRHVAAHLERLLDGDGRIPIEVYVGDAQALEAAQERRAAWASEGLRACLTTHAQTLASDGIPWALAVVGLEARVRALVLSAEVEALLIVVQTDELVDTGLPVEGVDAVHVVNRRIRPIRPERAEARRTALLALLDTWVWPARRRGGEARAVACTPQSTGRMIELVIVADAAVAGAAAYLPSLAWAPDEGWAAGDDAGVGAARLRPQAVRPWAGVQALLGNQAVSRAVIVAGVDEVLRHGLPVDRCEVLHLMADVPPAWMPVLRRCCVNELWYDTPNSDAQALAGLLLRLAGVRAEHRRGQAA